MSGGAVVFMKDRGARASLPAPLTVAGRPLAPPSPGAAGPAGASRCRKRIATRTSSGKDVLCMDASVG